MGYNHVLRKLRYAFDYSGPQMIEIFNNVNIDVSLEQVDAWLMKEHLDGFAEISNADMNSFLDGFIIKHRGKKDGQEIERNDFLDNNLVFRKVKIALSLKDTDIVELLSLSKFVMSKSEINAFFRNPEHGKYRRCQDQVLRVFLQGVIKKNNPSENNENSIEE